MTTIASDALLTSPPAPSVLIPMGRRLVAATLARLQLGSIELQDDQLGPTSVRGPRPGPAASLRVHDPRFYAAIASRGSVGAAEAYIAGYWTTGDLPRLIELLTLNIAALPAVEGPLARMLAPLARLGYWLRRNTRAGSRRNILAHYDLSNDFFATFLDPTMTYSSGVYLSSDATLAEAQHEKIDRACRKLDLKPTDHLLEIGTGWGALAIHAATRYGCRVTTTTISDQQHAHAQRRIAELNLQDRITLLKSDYRDLDGSYDKLVSIEMIEAVGRQYLAPYLAKCASLLKPTGMALIQAITIRDQADEAASRRVDFLKKYIFPGSCLIGLARFSAALRSDTDLDLVHIEQFGHDYARTLADWRKTFHANLSRVRALGYSDAFIRMWDYYLAYCEGAMRARHCGVAQITLAKPLARTAAGAG